MLNTTNTIFIKCNAIVKVNNIYQFRSNLSKFTKLRTDKQILIEQMSRCIEKQRGKHTHKVTEVIIFLKL